MDFEIITTLYLFVSSHLHLIHLYNVFADLLTLSLLSFTQEISPEINLQGLAFA
jgi:hypothetical protein